MQSAMHSSPSVAHCQTDTNRERESMVQIEGCVSSDMGGDIFRCHPHVLI